MFIRKKQIKGKIYYYICEVNSEGKQKVIKYLGTIKKILAMYHKAETGMNLISLEKNIKRKK